MDKKNKSLIMRFLSVIIAVFAVVFFILMIIAGGISYQYKYNVRVGQFVELADDASTAIKKLEFLQEYKDTVLKNINRNNARIIFKRERLTRDKQIIVLDTLIQRLTEASDMPADSFQYQQAMLQITGQEFEHALDSINEIFHSCWLRQSPFRIYALWVNWLNTIAIFIFGLWLYEKYYDYY